MYVAWYIGLSCFVFKFTQFQWIFNVRDDFRMLTAQNTRRIEVNLPAVTDIYNRKMGGIDLSDKTVQAYDPDTRTCKLWKRISVNILLKIMSTYTNCIEI